MRTPAVSWTPWKLCPDGDPANNCTQVQATVKIPGTSRVVMAGDFSEMRSPSGDSVAVDKLAAINDVDGSLDSNFAKHTFSGTIFSLESDGEYLYAAGSFTKVDGFSRGRVVRLDAATGALKSMKSGVSGPVYGTQLTNGTLYIGGNFTAVQGSARENLPALDAGTPLAEGTGALGGTWTPTARMAPVEGTNNDAAHNKWTVRDIESAGEGTRIYVSGDFDVVNGVSNVSTVAALDAINGSFASGWSTNKEFDASNWYQGMQLAVVDGDSSTAGVVLAGGGLINRAWRLNPVGRRALAGAPQRRLPGCDRHPRHGLPRRPLRVRQDDQLLRQERRRHPEQDRRCVRDHHRGLPLRVQRQPSSRPGLGSGAWDAVSTSSTTCGTCTPPAAPSTSVVSSATSPSTARHTSSRNTSSSPDSDPDVSTPQCTSRRTA